MSDTRAESLYPEHDKMAAIKELSQAVYDFIEWLPSQDCMIGQMVQYEDRDEPVFVPYYGSIKELIAKHFGIDLDKIEQEKRVMLDALRKDHGINE